MGELDLIRQKNKIETENIKDLNGYLTLGEYREYYREGWEDRFKLLDDSVKDSMPQPTKEDIRENIFKVNNLFYWDDNDYFWINVTKGMFEIDEESYNKIDTNKNLLNQEGIHSRLRAVDKSLLKYFNQKQPYYITDDSFGDTEYKETQYNDSSLRVKTDDDFKEALELVVVIIYNSANTMYKDYQNIEEVEGSVVGDIEEGNFKLWLGKSETKEKEKGKENYKEFFDVESFDKTTYYLLIAMGVVVSSPIVIAIGVFMLMTYRSDVHFLEGNKTDKRLKDKLNTMYLLEDKTPVRLYELLYVSNDKIILSTDVYKLSDEDNYKELVVDKITESQSIQLINRFHQENENNKKVLKYEKELKVIEQNTKTTQQAMGYISEYQDKREKNKNKLGLYHSNHKWTNKKDDIKKDMDKLLEENKQLKQNLNESLSDKKGKLLENKN